MDSLYSAFHLTTCVIPLTQLLLTAILCRFLLLDIHRGRNVLFKALLLGTLAAVTMMHLTVIVTGSSLSISRHYNIYDAAHSAAARWWMPYKVRGPKEQHAPRVHCQHADSLLCCFICHVSLHCVIY